MRLLALILVLCSPAFATNHFVRAAASGTASGADWTNAFTDLPSSLTCGDLYYVSSGTYGKHTFNDGCSVVTEVRAATIADHGIATGWSNAFQGEALFQATGSATNNSCDWEIDSSHYLFNGNGVRSADWQSGYLIRISNSNSLALTGAVCVGISSGGTVGAGTWVQDVTFDYINFDGPHSAVDTDKLTNVFTSWCGSVPHVNHSLAHDGGNVLVFIKGKHDSLAGAGSSLCNASSTGAQLIVENTYLFRNYSSAAQHGEGFVCDEGQYCTIRFNRFRDMTGTAFMATPSGCGRTTCNIDNQWDVYGNWFESKNTFSDNGVQCGVGGVMQIFDAKFSGDVKFFNNTMVNINSSICSNNAGGGNILAPGAQVDFQNVTIHNNLWHNNDNFSATTTCPAPNTCVSWTWDFSTYAGGQTTGGDSNAQTTASNLFVNIPTENFHLATDTSAWTSLGAPFNTDPDGVTRTTSRGAFQFVSGGASTNGTSTTGTVAHSGTTKAQ